MENSSSGVENTNSDDQKILVLVDLYQRIEDQGVSEFDDLDGEGRASLIRVMANDFMEQVADQLDTENKVSLLGLDEALVTFLDHNSLGQVTSDNASEFYDDGFIQFSITDMTKADWETNLANVSGDLDCIITAIGEHPKYEGIIKQGYAIGKLEDGMISDDDEDEFLNNEVWVKQYNTYFGS